MATQVRTAALAAVLTAVLVQCWLSATTTPSSAVKMTASLSVSEQMRLEGIVRAASEHHDAQEFGPAIRLYFTALKHPLLPSAPVVWFNLAAALEAVGDWDRALKAFNRSLVGGAKSYDNSRLSELHARIGELQSKRGEWARSAESLKLSVALADGRSSPRLLRNLGAALLNAGGSDEAVDVLREGLRLDPGHRRATVDLGVALARSGSDAESSSVLRGLIEAEDLGTSLEMYAGFMLEDCAPRLAKLFLVRCLQDLRRGAGAGKESLSVQLSSTYYHLGRLYRTLGKEEEERELYATALAESVWRHEEQRPAFVFPLPLSSQPWWELGSQSLLPEDSQGAQHRAQRWEALWKAVRILEDSFPSVRSELQLLLNAHPGRGGSVGEAASSERQGVTVLPDIENIVATGGSWGLAPFFRNGHRVPTNAEALFPAITAALEALRELNVTRNLPKGSAEVSIISPGTTLKAHCGPTNHRIRIHLALSVPKNPVPVLRVSGVAREWQEGKCLCFDDSFEHEVFWRGSATTTTTQTEDDDLDSLRAVLLIDAWHPDLDEEGRDQVRRHFQWSEVGGGGPFDTMGQHRRH